MYTTAVRSGFRREERQGQRSSGGFVCPSLDEVAELKGIPVVVMKSVPGVLEKEPTWPRCTTRGRILCCADCLVDVYAPCQVLQHKMNCNLQRSANDMSVSPGTRCKVSVAAHIIVYLYVHTRLHKSRRLSRGRHSSADPLGVLNAVEQKERTQHTQATSRIISRTPHPHTPSGAQGYVRVATKTTRARSSQPLTTTAVHYDSGRTYKDRLVLTLVSKRSLYSQS